MLQTGFIERFDREILPLSEAGGKAANLSALSEKKFPVPPGFVLLTGAYRHFMEKNDLEERMAPLLQAMHHGLLEPARASEDILSFFEKASLPEKLRNSIIKAYGKLEKETRKKGVSKGGLPVAVRSSATAEDLENASFAGQQDTYLDVSGECPLLLAIKRCWGSLWTERAIHYRLRNGIPHQGLSMAVVVQQMIRSEFSGVLFTADPLTGSRKTMLLESSRGLGEALVSGQVTPNRHMINRSSWAIEDRSTSKKDTQKVPHALSLKTIRKIAKLGERIEDHFGSPQDIEWAYADGEIHIIQSRPITTLYPLPSPMPNWIDTHLYVSFNAAEGMIEPFTPMGSYALKRTFSRFTSKGRVADGRREVHPVFVEAGGRLYADVTMFFRSKLLHGAIDYVIREFLSTDIDDFHRQLGGRKRFRYHGLPIRQTLKYIALPLPKLSYFPRALFSPNRARERYLGEARKFVEGIEKELDGVDDLIPLLDSMDRSLDLAFRNLILPAIPLGIAGAGLLTFAEILTRRGGGPRMDMKRLMKGAPYNLTMDMNRSLWSMAEGVASRGESSWWSGNDARTLAAQYFEGKMPKKTRNEVGRFLREFGHRGPGELDLGRARWGDDPTPLFEMICSMVSETDDENSHGAPFSGGTGKENEKADGSLQPEEGHLGIIRSRLLNLATRRIQALGGLREAPRFYCVRLGSLYRAALLRHGERMSKEGELGSPEDIFFLLPEELRISARNEEIDLKALAKRRRERYENEAGRRDLPLLLTSDGETFHRRAVKVSGNEMTCQPVSPGISKGRVRVIHDPGSSGLQPGEIIVCRATDPGWTPLFIRAGGLIMEIGGAATHGAIVAREFNLPAVAGFHDATVELRDGEEVMVDGTSGIVIRVDKKDDIGSAGNVPDRIRTGV